MRQTECLVINPTSADSYASLFKCTTAGGASDSMTASTLFPETCPYSVYRKDRNIHGGGVMLLVHKDISHMPITELENDSESI